MGDVDSMSPFMGIVKYSAEYQFVEWMLNIQCKNGDEKLKLIYNHNKDGDNALNFAGKTDLKFLLINTIKDVLSSYKKIKDIKIVIPIFLNSLERGDIKLSQWLLSLFDSNSDKRKL